MGLDPQAKSLLDQIAAMGGPQLHQMTVPEARQAIAALASLQAEPPLVAEVSDRTIPGPAGEIRVRVYTPAGTPPFPLLVYYHGGGWVIGSLDTHDGTCRSLANQAGCMVVSVDYRLAPEHKFPAAAEDAHAAAAWVAAHAAALRGDPARLAVGGDSAGGNLAAAAALMARDRGGPPMVFQLLVYPVTDARRDTPSYRQNADGYFLTADMMEWFWNHYLARPGDGDEAYASPLRAADLSGLPPALVITAELDPLRDEGEAYAKRLEEAGVPARISRYDGMIHGFFGMGSVLDRAVAAMAEAGATLKLAFAARR
jgi:acetyl esterase